MKRVELDGSLWRTKDDFYNALLPAIGAPQWHGRNLDALNDTIRGDDINDLRLQYTIHIQGQAEMGAEATATVERFRELIADRKAAGDAIV